MPKFTTFDKASFDLKAAFSAGACTAYDDCGHDIPPWWCDTEAARDAWKRGLASGYEDVKRLIQRDRANATKPEDFSANANNPNESDPTKMTIVEVYQPTARPLSEWNEFIGDVLWWRFPDPEAPYVGTPNDLGYVVEVWTYDGGNGPRVASRTTIGGWPGYHTHWTPLPPVPKEPES